jgi:hypothetical protein
MQDEGGVHPCSPVGISSKNGQLAASHQRSRSRPRSDGHGPRSRPAGLVHCKSVFAQQFGGVADIEFGAQPTKAFRGVLDPVRIDDPAAMKLIVAMLALANCLSSILAKLFGGPEQGTGALRFCRS